MAFVDLTNFITVSKGGDNVIYPFLYNVDMAVGPRSPNRYDDVMLVQYFLSRLVPYMVYGFSNKELALDGKFGKQTAHWILSYQHFRRSRANVHLEVDGRVDKHPPGGQLLVVPHMIRVLNMNYVQLHYNIPFDNILSYDPNVPPALVPIFKMKRTRG